ncbi:MAG: SDR family oxidoreductase [Bacteroidia bacterium]
MTILVTGASRGIGKEVVKFFLENQDVIVIAVSRSPMDFTHPHLLHIQGDVRDENVIKECKRYLSEKNFALDILVNNAGHLVHKPFESISKEEWYNVFETNVFAPFMWIKELLAFLKKSPNAHIVNISSMGGITGTQKFPGLSAYSSSKGALSILTECLAEELKTHHISCNALALGAVQTDMLASAFPNYKAPLSPAEMAQFIGWFAINGQKFFNGKILPVAVSTP